MEHRLLFHGTTVLIIYKHDSVLISAKQHRFGM